MLQRRALLAKTVGAALGLVGATLVATSEAEAQPWRWRRWHRWHRWHHWHHWRRW